MRDPLGYGWLRQAGVHLAFSLVLGAALSSGSAASQTLSGGGLGPTKTYRLGAASSGGRCEDRFLSNGVIQGWNARATPSSSIGLSAAHLSPKTVENGYWFPSNLIFSTPAFLNDKNMSRAYVNASGSPCWNSISRSTPERAAPSSAIWPTCAPVTRRHAVSCSISATRTRASAASFSSLAARSVALANSRIALPAAVLAPAAAIWDIDAFMEAPKAWTAASPARCSAWASRSLDLRVSSAWHRDSRLLNAISPITPKATAASAITPPHRSGE